MYVGQTGHIYIILLRSMLACIKACPEHIEYSDYTDIPVLLGNHNCCGILGVRVLRQPGEQRWIFSSGSCNLHTVDPSVGCRTERGTGHAGKMDWNQQTTENSKSDLMCRRSGGSCC